MKQLTKSANNTITYSSLYLSCDPVSCNPPNDIQAKHARDIISFKYYKNSTTIETMNTLLRNDKALTPNRIPYYITASAKRPGRFLLSYMPGSMPRHEPIGVSHVGFRFRGKIHNTFPSLVRWFKVRCFF